MEGSEAIMAVSSHQKTGERGEEAEAVAAATKIEPPDWSNLPVDLVNNVAEQVIPTVGDYIRFRVVCKGWHSARATPRPNSQLPWLLLGWDRSAKRLFFFSVGDSRTFSIAVPPTLNRRTRWLGGGSYDGWLILEDECSPAISLLNPLTGAQVDLPATSERIRKQSQKHVIVHEDGMGLKYSAASTIVQAIAMSSNPALSRDCTVVVISLWDGALVSIRVGAADWSLMDNDTNYHDVIHWKGSFYAVDYRGKVSMFDAELRKVAVTRRPPVDDHQMSLCWRFVQVWGGELVILRKILQRNPLVHGLNGLSKYKIENFEIFKVKADQGEISLVEVKSLGDHILFQGLCRSLCYPVADYPRGMFNSGYFVEEEYKMLGVGDVVRSVEPRTDGVLDAAGQQLPNASEIDYESSCFSTWHVPSLF